MDNNIQSFFSRLSGKLLRGGVAPRNIKRIVAELKDHYEDLHQQAIEQGATPEQATGQAISKLGKEDDLVEETLSRPELRSWSSRWPWAIYGIAPTLLFFLSMTLIISLSAFPLGTLAEGTLVSSPLKKLVETSFFVSEYLLALPIIALFCYQTMKRHDSMKWSIFGLILLCSFAAGIDFRVRWPEDSLEGFISVSLSHLPPFPIAADNIVKLAINLVSIGICLQWLRSRTGADSQQTSSMG